MRLNLSKKLQMLFYLLLHKSFLLSRELLLATLPGPQRYQLGVTSSQEPVLILVIRLVALP